MGEVEWGGVRALHFTPNRHEFLKDGTQCSLFDKISGPHVPSSYSTFPHPFLLFWVSVFSNGILGDGGGGKFDDLINEEKFFEKRTFYSF